MEQKADSIILQVKIVTNDIQACSFEYSWIQLKPIFQLIIIKFELPPQNNKSMKITFLNKN